MFKKARLSFLSFAVIIILAVALAFLYLLQRQEIYANLKNNNQKLIEKEMVYFDQMTNGWTDILSSLVKHESFRNYINTLVKGKDVSKVKYELEKTFNRVGARHFDQIRYIRFIDSKGMEKIVSKNAKATDVYRDLSGEDFFQRGSNTRMGSISKPTLEKWKDNAFIHRSIPIVAKNKRLGILSITIDVSKVLSRYDYLLAVNATDVIALVNKQGKVLYHVGADQFDKAQAETVYSVVKQRSMNSPILEYQENIWSYIQNRPYGFTVLLLSDGKNITAMLNSEYKKLAVVLFVGGFLLIFMVFFSTRKIHRQQIKVDRKKVITTQRSHNFASISGELRQPINTLLGSLVTLEETSLDLKQKNYANTAKRSADHLLALVDEFQDYSNISRGEFKLEKIEFDLRATIHDIAELMSAEAYKKGLEVSCLVSADVPERVLGDVTRLRQVMINLVSYAVRYTNHGEVSLCLSSDTHSQDTRYINIDISDTGGTIDQETMAQQITSFTDLDIDLDNDENYSGEGLGLALSKQLIELMAGEITMRENNLGGNTFRIRLPLPVIDVVRKEAAKQDLDGKRILIVGEIENNRNALSQAFARWGMSGAAMEEFDRVVNVLRDSVISGKKFDVCLIDVSLSSSSEKAFEIVRQIRLEMGIDELAIVTLTAQGVPGDARRAKELGIQAYLTKPVSRENMHKAILRIFDSGLDQEAEFVTKHSLKEGEEKNHQRILLAEHNPDVSKHLVKYFSQTGIHVDLADDGEKAERAIKSNIYDAVFISASLKGLNVFKFVRDFRKEEDIFNSQLNGNLAEKIHMPIIAVVSVADDQMFDKCEANGISEVIQSPYEESDLNQIISRCFSES